MNDEKARSQVGISPHGNGKGYRFEHNIVYMPHKGVVSSGDYYVSPGLDSIHYDYNLYFGAPHVRWRKSATDAVKSLAAWQAEGFDPHSVYQDPLFVDPQHGNYDVAPKSPAKAIHAGARIPFFHP